jgi:hypothetical protein
MAQEVVSNNIILQVLVFVLELIGIILEWCELKSQGYETYFNHRLLLKYQRKTEMLCGIQFITISSRSMFY